MCAAPLETLKQLAAFSVVAGTVLLLLTNGACTSNASPDPAGTALAKDAGQAAAPDAPDTGLLLAVLVPPVILVALGWLAYIFRLIFRESPNSHPPNL
jgi:hypothetical protein